ncbi:MAG: aminopeptidase [Cyclobacteriaceae bacterium]|nr:aminopeptidase [Cyclobacteriaceae bacterium]
MNKAALLLSLLLVICFSCNTQKNKTDEVATSYLNWQAIADQLIKQSQLQSGEQVLLVGQVGQFEPLVPLLKEGIESAGAKYLGTMSIDNNQPEAWRTDFTTSLGELNGEELVLFLSSVDLGIMLPGATPADKVYGGLQAVLNQGKGRTIHFHWQGAYDLNGRLMEPDSTIDLFYENVLLHTNYDALAAKQIEFDNAMRDNWITVTTPTGTDIQFQIGDRKVTKQDGNASLNHMATATTLIDREVELPAGAIRVAPMEETVSGTIAFPDSEWGGQLVKGLVMKFEDGKVVEVQATENIEAVQEEMKNAGEAGKSFREFALGFNPMLAIPDDKSWIPYYGYGGGVVRLSLGDNSELGGNVGGGYVRWNFFTDATVKVGEEVWVDGGKLIK